MSRNNGDEEMIKKTVPLPTCFYHFGDLVIPPDTAHPRPDATRKCLVGHWTGRGQVDALCFRTDYHGVWFGYQIDDYPFEVAHNGCCLQNMGLIGQAANGMPYYLPYYNGPDDLSVACRKPLQFNKSFKLWMGNSHATEAKKCIGLHVYITGYNIEPAEGNLLEWTLLQRERHPYTRPSAETIKVQRCKQPPQE